jgi:endoglucanase
VTARVPGLGRHQHLAAARRWIGFTLSLFVVATTVACAPSPPGARVDGNQLADAQGRPLRLLGVVRSGTEYACIQGWGIFDGPTAKWAVEAMRSWAINAVRLPLNEDCWLGINGAPPRYSGARYRAAIRAYEARLKKAGLYVVLDLHWNAPGTAKATGQQPMADLDHAPLFWKSVARAFRRDPKIIFDLYNEPNGVDWRCWRDGCMLPQGWRTAGMQNLVDAVRSTGALQPIILSGLDFAGNLSSWLKYRPKDPADQLAAGFHVFDFTACRSRECWNNTVAPVARQVPVITTEVGQSDCSSGFLDEFLSWADAARVSYLGWSWNTSGCGAPALIQSWDGQPTQSGSRFRAHLQSITASLSKRSSDP